MRRISVVNAQRLDRLSNPRDRFDLKATLASGFPYGLSHASTLAGLLAQSMQDALPKKGLITDLDNTLWNGIVGDAGAQAVWWDLDHHSQIHGLYQQFLNTLAQEGVLVAVASKNDFPVVEEVFRRNDILLPRERVFPWAVDWQSKSKAMAEILKTWNVDPDSVVFVDDNPAELAEVQTAYPQMECV